MKDKKQIIKFLTEYEFLCEKGLANPETCDETDCPLFLFFRTFISATKMELGMKFMVCGFLENAAKKAQVKEGIG